MDEKQFLIGDWFRLLYMKVLAIEKELATIEAHLGLEVNPETKKVTEEAAIQCRLRSEHRSLEAES